MTADEKERMASRRVTGKSVTGRFFYVCKIVIALILIFFFIMADKKFVQMDLSNVILI
jgi:hypothetical protein